MLSNQAQVTESVSKWQKTGFYASYFLVQKKTGNLHLILHLKRINCLIESPSVKMDTLNLSGKGHYALGLAHISRLKGCILPHPYPIQLQKVPLVIQNWCCHCKALRHHPSSPTLPRITPVMQGIRFKGARAFPSCLWQ